MFIDLLPKLDLVIFDWDGTLVDSNGIHNAIDVELTRHFGEKKDQKSIIEERNNVLKNSNSKDIYLDYCDYLKNKYNINMSKEDILKLRREISKNYLKEVKFKPQADEIIKYLKEQNIKMALATVSRTEDINIYKYENEFIKNKCDIENDFDYIITKDDVKFKKPNPEVYNRIIEKFNINDLSKCVVIEDSLSGILAAKKAKLNVIAVYDEYSNKDRNEINKLADYQVKDFGELIDLFKKSK